MPGKREPRSSRMLKAPAAMVASVAVQRGLHVGWKLVTGQEPPTGPDDKQVPLGQAVAWTALFGAAVAGARMIAGRYVSAFLAPRRQGPGLPEPIALPSTRTTGTTSRYELVRNISVER